MLRGLEGRSRSWQFLNGPPKVDCIHAVRENKVGPLILAMEQDQELRAAIFSSRHLRPASLGAKGVPSLSDSVAALDGVLAIKAQYDAERAAPSA
jgi:hypothetical protein